ncbi:MAG: class I SAM-dependent methyltransferase [Candidatus Hydrogenedentes bacterium]|nr:class I SAM-dependent methyltransferase [Candidatus Hydrogenedentota bacterium]
MDPTARFSDRVENYIRFRPGYPAGLMDALEERIGLDASWVVADVGSGTGILSAVLLSHGNTVYGVEPNQEMREAAERLLGAHGSFHSVAGSAEDTGLAAESVDLVTAGQAFHWFDRDRAHREFARILRPGGYVALVWNDRKPGATPFLESYERLLVTQAIDYNEVNHRNVDDAQLARFFGAGNYLQVELPNAQHFDWEGLRGRALSCSYVPGEGHPAHAQFMGALREIYEAHQTGGEVIFEYDTRLYAGCLRQDT